VAYINCGPGGVARPPHG